MPAVMHGLSLSYGSPICLRVPHSNENFLKEQVNGGARHRPALGPCHAKSCMSIDVICHYDAIRQSKVNQYRGLVSTFPARRPAGFWLSDPRGLHLLLLGAPAALQRESRVRRRGRLALQLVLPQGHGVQLGPDGHQLAR